MSKSVKIILIIILAIFIIGVLSLMGCVVFYYNSLDPVNSQDAGENIKIEIPEGTSIAEISNKLAENGVIKNSFTFKVYLKLNNKTNLQAGKYEFNNGTDNVESIVKKLNSGKILDEAVTITFVEGKNMRYIARTIAENTANTEDSVFELLENKEYIQSLVNDYWFITDEVEHDNIYYPLEGYLLPDTYKFENKEISVKDIFKKILDYTDKYLTAHREEIEETGLTVHQLLTLASITELEGSTKEERAEIVGVFYNRLAEGMSLGSDVTTYYAVKKDMAEGDLTQKEIKTESLYNTRADNMKGLIPIGPIGNPSKDSIEATINYKQTDALYFVSDINKKVYFTKTYQDHLDLIQNLKDTNLWYTYNN